MSDEVRFDRRMSDADALLWKIEEDPLLRSTTTAVAVLDRSPDRARLESAIERGTRMIPRMRQRVASAPLAGAPPRWIVDPDFDLRYHLRHVKVGGDGSMRDLLDLVQPLAMQRFDGARPLWELTVVEGLTDGRAAIVQKIHRALADGVGEGTLAMVLLDLERDPQGAPAPMPEAPEPEHLGRLDLVREAVGHEWRRQLGMTRRMVTALPAALAAAAADPGGTARAVRTTATALGRLLAPTSQPASPVMQGRSLRRHLDTLTAPLAEMKAAAGAVDATLADACVAAVAGGLRHYHRRHATIVDALRMTTPITRGEGESLGVAGSRLTPAHLEVPVNIADPMERLKAVRDLARSRPSGPALGVTDALAGVLNRLPTTVTTALLASMLKGVDVVTSHVPGAPIPVYLAGAKLDASFAFGPLGGAATNLTLLSYCDALHIGVTMDLEAIRDPVVFMGSMQQGFDEIRGLG